MSGGENRLVGTWRLRSLENAEQGECEDAPACGQPRADGLIMYDANGFMSAQIISPASPAEARSREHHAYFGTYTVDTAGSIVTHHRIANNNLDAPADVVRQYRFTGNDTLELFPEGHPAVRLTFQRIT